MLFTNSSVFTVKKNKDLNSRASRFNQSPFNQEVKLKKEFRFKEPTEEELILLKKKNEKFLLAEMKRKRRGFFLLLIFVISVFVLFLKWLV